MHAGALAGALAGATIPRAEEVRKVRYELTSETFVGFKARNLWSAAWLAGCFKGR